MSTDHLEASTLELPQNPAVTPEPSALETLKNAIEAAISGLRHHSRKVTVSIVGSEILLGGTISSYANKADVGEAIRVVANPHGFPIKNEILVASQKEAA